MIIAGIDGACRRNGKPNCLSAGATYIRDTESNKARIRTVVEQGGSTNQRGELNALLLFLDNIIQILRRQMTDVILVTDSEYIYNALTKEWYKNWENKGWINADGEPTKNKDIWQNIANCLEILDEEGMEVTAYHVKGHAISVGKVTGTKLVDMGDNCKSLYQTVAQKVELAFSGEDQKAHEKVQNVIEVFERNHDFVPPPEVLKQMLVVNNTTDIIAGVAADKADAAWTEK